MEKETNEEQEGEQEEKEVKKKIRKSILPIFDFAIRKWTEFDLERRNATVTIESDSQVHYMQAH